jgi:hypothetical protein
MAIQGRHGILVIGKIGVEGQEGHHDREAREEGGGQEVTRWLGFPQGYFKLST